MLLSIITSLHIFICVLLIILVLLQQGKGADAGVTLGGGGGNTVFGAAGADNFITRFTTVLACCFMITSVYLGVQSKPGSPAEGRLFKDVAQSSPAKSVDPVNSTSSASSEPAAAATSDSETNPVAAPVAEQVSTIDANESKTEQSVPQEASSNAPEANEASSSASATQ